MTDYEVQTDATAHKTTWSDAFVENPSFQPAMSENSMERVKLEVSKTTSIPTMDVGGSETVQFVAQQANPQQPGKRRRQKKQTPVVRAVSGVRTRSQSKGNGYRPEKFECLVPKTRKKARKGKHAGDSANGNGLTQELRLAV